MHLGMWELRMLPQDKQVAASKHWTTLPEFGLLLLPSLATRALPFSFAPVAHHGEGA